jgi:hypothetical protein
MPMDLPVGIPFLLQLKEEDVWSLPKSELRKYFLALQSHARNPQDLSEACVPPPASPPSLAPTLLPPFLLLPPEVRDIIYTHLLSPPASTPIRGPHPRQLQTQIALSQSFAPAILRVNRQIYSEALLVFYGSSTQCVHITIDYNVWSHKVQRSDFLMSGQVTAAMRHFHINIHLGNEKKTNRPEKEDGEARLAVVRKGARKLGKWLGGTEVKSLRISWHEPPKTYTWEQKKEVLDEFRTMRAELVHLGVVNWGLCYPGKKYQFRPEYLASLQRDRVEHKDGIDDRPGY